MLEFEVLLSNIKNILFLKVYKAKIVLLSMYKMKFKIYWHTLFSINGGIRTEWIVQLQFRWTDGKEHYLMYSRGGEK